DIMESIVKDIDKLSKANNQKDILSWYKDILMKAEAYNRFKVYKKLRKQGRSIDEAISHAKEVTVNFDRMGDYTPLISTFVAFFNAGAQALYQPIMQFRDKKQIIRYLSVALTYAIMGFANKYLNDILRDLYYDDDDDKDKNKEDKDKNDDDYTLYRLPKNLANRTFNITFGEHSVILP
ncbi:MAG: hypothetical protein ACP5RD_08930, partial [bacterium]